MAKTAQPVIREKTSLAQLIARMELNAQMDTEDKNGSAVNAAISAIMAAETEEEMLKADQQAPPGGRDLVDVEQTIYGYSVKFSRDVDEGDEEFKSIFVSSSGRPMYLIVRAAYLETGQNFVWNTSGTYLVPKLFWLDGHGMFPWNGVIRGTKIGSRKTVLKLDKVGDRPIAAEMPF